MSVVRSTRRSDVSRRITFGKDSLGQVSLTGRRTHDVLLVHRDFSMNQKDVPEKQRFSQNKTTAENERMGVLGSDPQLLQLGFIHLDA